MHACIFSLWFDYGYFSSCSAQTLLGSHKKLKENHTDIIYHIYNILVFLFVLSFVLPFQRGLLVLFLHRSSAPLPVSARCSPKELFGLYDDLADEYGIYKVETVGDAYIAGQAEPWLWPVFIWAILVFCVFFFFSSVFMFCFWLLWTLLALISRFLLIFCLDCFFVAF